MSVVVVDIRQPLKYRVMLAIYDQTPFVGRENELVQLAVNCATNAALHRKGFPDSDGKPIISQSPQMFGSGKTRLGFEFVRASQSPGIQEACREKLSRDKLNEFVTESDLNAVKQCEAISIDINENAMPVSHSAHEMEMSLATLIARGLYQRLDKPQQKQFIDWLSESSISVQTVFDVYSRIVPERRVFVHVDEVGLIQVKCAIDEELKKFGALSVFREFRVSLLNIVKAGHFVFVTGNTPILFALGKSEQQISPCDTRTILIDPLRETDVEVLLNHFECEKGLVKSVAKNVMDATSGIPRLVHNCLNLMVERKHWLTSRLLLDDFNIVAQFNEWNPPPPSESLRKLLKLAVYDIALRLDDVFEANVVKDILDKSNILSPAGTRVSVLEACRAFNLFLISRKDEWHIVWPRVILLKWKKYWEDEKIWTMSLLCKSALDEPGMLEPGRMLETVVKRAVRRRIVTTWENTSDKEASLAKAFPFLSGTWFADQPISAPDGYGRYEYMPKIVMNQKVRIVPETFDKWSEQLNDAYKNDGKSTTLDDSNMPKHTWKCHVENFPKLRSAMPKNCIYDPLDKSSSEDLLVRFSTCDLKIQDKNTNELQPNVLGKEIKKVIDQQLDCPTLLIIAAVMPEEKYKLPVGGSLILSTKSTALGEEQFEAGKIYTNGDLDWDLGEYLHVLYLNESGMRQFIHDEDFDFIRNNKNRLVDVLSPVKSQERDL